MKYSYDRREGDMIVLVDDTGDSWKIPAASVDPVAREGDLLRAKNGTYHVDAEATAARRERILRLQNRLRRK